MTDIIKCEKCGKVLISGSGASCLFGSGASLGCRNCGTKYVFNKTTALTAKAELSNLSDAKNVEIKI